MICGLGIDICPVERIAGILERQGGMFADRVYTASEKAYAEAGPAVKNERYAARFAAKEATIKALGGPPGLKWTEMEVSNNEDGVPSLLLHGEAAKCAERLGATQSWLTITHAGGVAVAVVILEREDK